MSGHKIIEGLKQAIAGDISRVTIDGQTWVRRNAETDDLWDLVDALAKLRRELPGWWWRVGDCSVSADSTIGPDRAGPDARLLEIKLFDEGFDNDLRQPATVAEALLGAIEKGQTAKMARGAGK